MKRLFVLLLLAVGVFALNPTTTTYTPTSGGVISAAGERANRDSLRNGINQTKDTVNIKAKRDQDTLFSPRIGGTLKVDSVNVVKGIGGTLRVDSVNIGSGSSTLLAINILSGTLNGSGGASPAYPSGYSVSNTVIVSCIVYVGTSNWSNYAISSPVVCSCFALNLDIFAGTFGINKPYKLVIAKIN